MFFGRCFTALWASALVLGCSEEPHNTATTPSGGASGSGGVTGGAGAGTGGRATGGDGPDMGGSTTGGAATGGSTQTSGGSLSGTGGNAGNDATEDAGNGGDGAEGGSGGDGAQAGAAAGGASAAGTGGDNQGGSGFDADDFFGIEEGDTIPHRKLNFTFDGGQDIAAFRPSDANPAADGGPSRTNNTQRAGVNSCANKMLGKLLVNLDYEGGNYNDWAAQRGFHVFGVAFYKCNSIDRFWEKRDRDYPGDCRLEAFDGQDHDREVAVDLAHSITGHLQDGLRYLHERDPSQDWEYFLNEDGTVRWSDVALTGQSHGAQSVVRFSKVMRLYRSVARSGPRDNGCGRGSSSSPFDPNNPPWDPNCPTEQISSWLDEDFATPIERVFGLTGARDSQYGDIMFSMERMNFVGEFVNLDNARPPFDSNRFYSLSSGHGTFWPNEEPQFEDVMNYVFGVPEENRNGCE